METLNNKVVGGLNEENAAIQKTLEEGMKATQENKKKQIEFENKKMANQADAIQRKTMASVGENPEEAETKESLQGETVTSPEKTEVKPDDSVAPEKTEVKPDDSVAPEKTEIKPDDSASPEKMEIKPEGEGEPTVVSPTGEVISQTNENQIEKTVNAEKLQNYTIEGLDQTIKNYIGNMSKEDRQKLLDKSLKTIKEHANENIKNLATESNTSKSKSWFPNFFSSSKPKEIQDKPIEETSENDTNEGNSEQDKPVKNNEQSTKGGKKSRRSSKKKRSKTFKRSKK